MKSCGTFLSLLLVPSLLLAQPAEWVPVPTNAAGTLLGTVTVAGEPAMAGDWVAAFDETGVCAGATEVVLNAGDSFVSLPIYGDDATTPDTDEGMGGGEGFTLRLWRSASGEILYYPDPEEPALSKRCSVCPVGRGKLARVRTAFAASMAANAAPSAASSGAGACTINRPCAQKICR